MITINEVIAETRRAAKSVYLTFYDYASKAKAAIKAAIKTSLRFIDDLRHWAIVKVIRFIRFWVSLRDVIGIIVGLIGIPWIIYKILVWLSVPTLVSTIIAFAVALSLVFIIVSGILRRGNVPREDAQKTDIHAWDFVADLPGVKFVFYAALSLAISYGLYSYREYLPNPPHIKILVRYVPYFQTTLNIEQSCEQDDLWACAVLGERLYLGQDAPQDHARSVPLFERACSGDESNQEQACFYLGRIHDAGLGGIRRNDVRATELYQKACDLGSPSACINLSLAYQTGKGVNADGQKAVAIMKDACEVKEIQASCATLGFYYLNAMGVSRDVPRGRDLVAKACDEGSGNGCLFLSDAISQGVGEEANDAKAAEYLKRACDLNFHRGCARLASITYYGRGVVENKSEAAIIWQKACALMDAESCDLVAQMYAVGDGVSKDSDRAKLLYKKGCEAGSSSFGCILDGLK